MDCDASRKHNEMWTIMWEYSDLEPGRVAGFPTPGSSQTNEARQLLHYQYLLKFDKAVQKLDDGHSFMKSHLPPPGQKAVSYIRQQLLHLAAVWNDGILVSCPDPIQ
ncbi:hypothetical protein EMCRGX_G027045 [Ephydatia muelleri]